MAIRCVTAQTLFPLPESAASTWSTEAAAFVDAEFPVYEAVKVEVVSMGDDGEIMIMVVALTMIIVILDCFVLQ